MAPTSDTPGQQDRITSSAASERLVWTDDEGTTWGEPVNVKPLPWLSAVLHGTFGGAIIGIDLSMVIATWRAIAFGVLIGVWAAWGVIRGGMEVRRG